MMLPHPLTLLPFVGLLLCIALLPLGCGHWWESNRNKALVAVPLGGLVVGYLLLTFGGLGWEKIVHTLIEYVQFMILLGALYTISGGIVLTGDLEASPGVNVLFLFLGAVLANLIGTTGASMLLIRPLLKTNSERKHVVHTVIFFIFLVSNIGGSLTPLGDPPLFLGFLQGVPFTWTLSLWRPWSVTVVFLLFLYFLWDTVQYSRESKRDLQRDRTQIQPLKVTGTFNFFFLCCVIGSVVWVPSPFREGVLLLVTGLSIWLTPRVLRAKNKFTYGPIIEVAVLFIGIFMTMIPALLLLEAKGASLGINQPWKFFWITGVLSSFLDNAPTYLVFFQTAQGVDFHGAFGALIGTVGGGRGVPDAILQAISLGAVFMGANSYIGNGPNFMVKAIAEENKVKMPSFFGYMKYSVGILIPTFLLITWMFFR